MKQASEARAHPDGSAARLGRASLWALRLTVLGAATAFAWVFLLYYGARVNQAGHRVLDIDVLVWLEVATLSIVATFVMRLSRPLAALLLLVCAFFAVAYEYSYWGTLPSAMARSFFAIVPWLVAAALLLVDWLRDRFVASGA